MSVSNILVLQERPQEVFSYVVKLIQPEMSRLILKYLWERNNLVYKSTIARRRLQT